MYSLRRGSAVYRSSPTGPVRKKQINARREEKESGKGKGPENSGEKIMGRHNSNIQRRKYLTEIKLPGTGG